MKFSYVITSCAKKDHVEAVESDVDTFIHELKRRGPEIAPHKDGTGIIPATFKSVANLNRENLSTVTALILDVDGKKRVNGELVIEPVDPEWFLSKLPWRGVAHTSYNHGPALAKFRVILPLAEPLDHDSFQRLWYWVYERVDKKCDPACKNGEHMYYLPRGAKDTVEAGWHWIRELYGPLLSFNDVPADFVSPEERRPVASSRHLQGAHFAWTDAPQFAVGDGHKLLEEFMELPLVKWAMERPEAVSYPVWRGIATNLAAIVNDHPNDDEIYNKCHEAFHEISRADGERYNARVAAKTFKDAIKAPGPVSYSYMTDNGAPGNLDADNKAPIGTARTAVKRKEREERVRQAAEEVKKAEGLIPKVETPTPDASTSLPSTEATDDEPEFSHYLFDAVQSGWLIKDDAGVWHGPFTDFAFNVHLKKSFHPKKLDEVKSSIREFMRREAIFDCAEDYVVRDGAGVFNTYRPSTLEPLLGTWPDIEALIMNLVGGDRAAFEYVLDWVAKPLQSLRNDKKPYKMGTAIVFQGEQGSGKGVFQRLIQTLYGESNCVELSQDMLDSRFNGELVDKLFVTANEVMSSTNRSMETTNKLKMWITDDKMPIEQKYLGAKQYPNYFNIIFTSNDYRPVIIEKTDRRFSVFHSKKWDETTARRFVQNDLKTKSKKQVRAFYDHLLNRKVSVQFGEFYRTQWRDNVIAESLPAEDRFAFDVKRKGWLAVSAPWVLNAPPNQPREATFEGNQVLADTIAQVFNDYCKMHNLRGRMSTALLITTMREVSPKMHKTRTRIGGIQRSVWHDIPMHGDTAEVIPLVPEEDRTPAVQADDADLGS